MTSHDDPPGITNQPGPDFAFYQRNPLEQPPSPVYQPPQVMPPTAQPPAFTPTAAQQTTQVMPSSQPTPDSARAQQHHATPFPPPPHASPHNHARPPLPPQYVQPQAYPTYQTPPPPKRKPRRLGAFVAVAILAAGVGGASGVTLDRVLTTTTPSATVSAKPASPRPTPAQGTQSGSATAPDWAATAQVASKSTVSISVSAPDGRSSGSGVVIDSQGHIVTNHHVIASALDQGRILVQIGDQLYTSTIVGTDASSDLAVLKIENTPASIVPIRFADSSSVRVGDPVMAIGNPLGLSGTVTTGIVSALNRPVVTGVGQTTVVTNAIQTSAAINPGNSGGALVNARGELIGINSAIATLGESTQGTAAGNIGIGFAIESNLVKSITDQIIKTGQANHAWLGVGAKDASATRGDANIVGAQITTVGNDTPASKAGLRTGDLVTKVEGKKVASLKSLIAVIRSLNIGQEVSIEIIRDGTPKTLKAKLVAAPK